MVAALARRSRPRCPPASSPFRLRQRLRPGLREAARGLQPGHRRRCRRPCRAFPAARPASVAAPARGEQRLPADLSPPHRTARPRSLEEAAAAAEEITTVVHRSAEETRRRPATWLPAPSDRRRCSPADVVGEAVEAMASIESSARRIAPDPRRDRRGSPSRPGPPGPGTPGSRPPAAGDAAAASRWSPSEGGQASTRSADAAKEIKALIMASTGQVETGADLVRHTGEALRSRSSPRSRRLNGTGRRHRRACAGTGARQCSSINTTVADIDRTTQQNAASVQRSQRRPCLRPEAGHRGPADSASVVEGREATTPVARAA